MPFDFDRFFNPMRSPDPESDKAGGLEYLREYLSDLFTSFGEPAKFHLEKQPEEPTLELTPTPTSAPTPIPTPTLEPTTERVVAPRWKDLVSKIFPEDQVNNTLNVIMGESSGNERGEPHLNPDGTKDYGLLQINDIHEKEIKDEFGWSMEDMYDPEKNLKVARWLFDDSLKRWGNGWCPWKAAGNYKLRKGCPITDKKGNIIGYEE